MKTKTISWRDFLALTVSVAVVGLGLGTTLPLTALTLDQRGFGNHIVGLMTAFGALGVLVVVPFVGRIVARVGPRCTMIVAVCLASFFTCLMQFSDTLFLWGLTRFVFGAAVGVLFTIGEAWLNRLAPDTSRARLFALYATTFTLFQLFGPLIVTLLDDKPHWNFVICGALFLLSIPGLLCMNNVHYSAENENIVRWQSIVPRMPVIILGTIFFALFDALTLSLLPLFGIRHGLAVKDAVLAVTIVLLGNSTLQFPLGWLADYIGRVRVHLMCGVVTVILLPLIPFVIHTPWLWWSLLYILGGAAGGIYILSLVACGERFAGAYLITASAVVNVIWGITIGVGPVTTGVLMQVVNVNGYVLVLWLAACGFVMSLWWESRPRYKRE